MSRRALLHVDDNPDDIFLFRKACSQAAVSFPLQSVESGKQALDYLQGIGLYSDRARFPLPDLVLIDLKMPPPDGFGLVRWIRSRPELNQLPICILTSSFQYQDIKRAYAERANCFLTKPPSIERLIALAAALDRSLSKIPPQLDSLKQLPEFRH
jgi:CheY-like chemotaxis protein